MKAVDISVSQNNVFSISMKHMTNDFEQGHYNSFFNCLYDFTNIDTETLDDFINKARYYLSTEKFSTRIHKKYNSKNNIEFVIFTIVGEK